MSICEQVSNRFINGACDQFLAKLIIIAVYFAKYRIYSLAINGFRGKKFKIDIYIFKGLGLNMYRDQSAASQENERRAYNLAD